MDPLRRGEEQWRSGDLRGAEAAFREALAARPGDAQAILGLGAVLAEQDRFDAALRILDQATAPDQQIARLRADIFRRSGRVEKAIALLQDVVTEDPLARTAWQELALDLATSGRTSEAQQTLAQALERLPRDPYLWAVRGAVAALGGAPEEAVESYDMAMRCAGEAPPHWRLLLKSHLANALDMAGSSDRAIELYRQVIDEDPEHRLALVQLGIVLWRRERMPEAARVLREAYRRFPEEHDAAYYLGDAERRLGHLEESERVFRAAIERWPECANCLLGLAEALQEQSRPGEAALALRHVLAERPDDADALGLFAAARYDIGEAEAAREIFEQAIRLAPHELRHIYNFALRERDAGRLEAATALFDKAVALAPANDRALYFASVCRIERGLVDEAIPLLERFLEQAPPARAIVRADPIFDPVKKHPRYRALVDGSLLDFAEPARARDRLSAVAAELPKSPAAAAGTPLPTAIDALVAAATDARTRRGEVGPPPRYYFETTRDGDLLVLAERDAAAPASAARRIATLERLGDDSYRACRL